MTSSNSFLENSWFSQDSVNTFSPPDCSLSIPVIISENKKHYPCHTDRLPPVRKILRIENKCLQALSLPIFTVYNMRSIWDKIKCFGTDMHERIAAVSFLSEIWEKSESINHKSKIEELLEMQHISYISTPRPGARRGGGAGIAFNPKYCTVTKLNISIPSPLEVVWALLRPLEATGPIRKIILCSLYSPPNSKKNKLLVDHISVTYNTLKILHPESGIIICGDKNSLDEKRILALDPNFRQILSENTRQDKRLYLVITDLHKYYHRPEVIPPVPVDVSGKGVPSDHKGVLVVPLSAALSQRKTFPVTRKVRPLPASAMVRFGSAIAQENWSFLTSEMTSTELVEAYQNYTSYQVEQYFPEKEVRVSEQDKPYFTEELRNLRRRRQRAYHEGGKSQKYIDIRNEFNKKLKQAAEKYRVKIIDEVSEGTRANAYSALRKLESGDNKKQNSFTLPEHADRGLTPSQSAECLAVYFSKISQEFDPINPELFPPWIKLRLVEGKDDCNKPVLEDWQVHKKLSGSKKPNFVIPGDLPVKLVKEFTPELAKPVTKIYNQITQSGIYPRQWVVEHQVAIPKVTPPQKEEDLRNISGTAYLSKQYESFIGDWILPYVEPYIDPAQCGGLRRSSIAHYLVKLLHFVHVNVEKTEPHAVLLALIDLEKAFNRVSHQLVIEDLADLHVPG